jgi:hypothetical protein
MNKKHLLFLSSLFCMITLAVMIFATFPQAHAHAQDCMDCLGGGGPGPEPPEPVEPPGGGGGDKPDKPDDPRDPTDPPCASHFDAPTIDANLLLQPPYPITLGQDPDDRGVDVNGIVARGGNRHCPIGGPAKIVSFSVVKVQLAQSSIDWIRGDLARKYPGAQVKDSYPITVPYQVSGLSSSQVRLSFHLAPLDPGYYEVTVLATQQDGQTISATLRIPVYLMESTIIQ